MTPRQNSPDHEDDLSTSLGVGHSAYARLRAAILDGSLPPNMVVSQLDVSRRFGISRTPLREAIHKLQSEGLLTVSPRRQVQVASLSPADVEEIFSLRLLIESVGTSISVPQFTEADVRLLAELLEQVNDNLGSEPSNAAHLQFHELLLTHAGPRFVAQARQLRELCRWYMSTVVMPGPTDRHEENLSRAREEHQEILDAARARDGKRAGAVVAQQLGWSGLVAVATGNPLHDPVRIRMALLHVEGATS